MVWQDDLFVMKNQRSSTPGFPISYLVPFLHSRSPTVSSARPKQRSEFSFYFTLRLSPLEPTQSAATHMVECYWVRDNV